jgi:hypothetical protein
MISVGIASIPQREASLERVLDSLTNQVDNMYIALNGHEHVPDYFEKYDNIHFLPCSNVYGDAMKFWWADMVDGYYVAWDDDLVATEGTIALLLSKCVEHGCPVSFHGKVYSKYPVENYRKDFSENYRCLGRVDGDHNVNIIGSGCMLFDTSKVRITMDDFGSPNCADFWFSLACHRHGIPLKVIEHYKDQLQHITHSWTIWKDKPRDGKENEIINEILRP